MFQCKHINLQLLNEVSAGNTDLIRDLALMYSRQAPSFYDQLDSFYRNNDLQSLGKLAHKIKGAISALGMSSLALTMKQLELSAQQGNTNNDCGLLIDQYKTTSIQALAELNSMLNKL